MGSLLVRPEFSFDRPLIDAVARAEGRDVILSAGQYFFQQTLLVNPLTAPIWITGLIAFFFSSRLKPYRLFGWSYLVCYGVFFALHGKSYYLAPIYPMLLAAGAVIIDFALSRPRVAWLKPAIVVILLVSGAHLAPVVVPVLSPDRFIAYTKYLPFKLPHMEHSHARAVLPQWYADQFGWEEIVDETSVAWNRLGADERRDCGIFAGRQLRLPRPTGGVREAQRIVGQGIHGRDQAVPPPPRVPRDDPHNRTGVAEALGRASTGQCARLVGIAERVNDRGFLGLKVFAHSAKCVSKSASLKRGKLRG